MVAFLRSVDGEVEHWYQEAEAIKSRTEEQRSERASESGTAAAIENERMVRMEQVVAKKQELLAAALTRRVRVLREQLERRE